MACRRELLSDLFRPSGAAPFSRVGVPARRLARRNHAVAAASTRESSRPWPVPARHLCRPHPHQLVPIRRSHSQAAAQGKIWEFKDVQKLVQASKAGTAQNTILVDTREPGELESTGRIPTAINIPITSQPDSFHITDDEFADRFDFPRPSRDAELVLYCKAGVRSRAAAQLARDAGWKNVAEYSGSWLDWDKNGGEVQR